MSPAPLSNPMVPSPESPRATLERARYFLSQAAGLRGDQRDLFTHNLDAAIVFGRAVYPYLESRTKVSGIDPGCVAWFRGKAAAMRTDPLLEYFRDYRNLTLKERQPQPAKRAYGQLSVAYAIAMNAEGKGSHPEPWYRRGRHALCQDIRGSVQRPLRRWRYRAGLRIAVAKHATRGRLSHLRSWWRSKRYVPSVRELYLGADPEGLDRNAIQLVTAYLDRLDAIVAEAETQFPGAFA